MTLLQQTGDTQNLPLFVSALYCEEEAFDGDFADDGDGFREESTNGGFSGSKYSPFSHLLEHDLFWEDSEVEALISKENETRLCFASLIISDEALMEARKEAIDWILRVNGHYRFCALTAVLAVNYFDRFVLSIGFQREKPWVNQLTAVACLSLAAKVQETRVPLLVDLQVEESKYVFEAKTVQRMELLVMSTLQWRMHPVTPIAFFDHITRRLLKSCLQWEFICRCESLLLSAISDVRIWSFVPSVMAAAIMLHVIKESEPYIGLEYQEQLIDAMKTPEDKVNQCFELIQELLHRDKKKRKHFSIPNSPIGVMDASFSCDSSSDSWFVESSSSLLSPCGSAFKRRRMQ